MTFNKYVRIEKKGKSLYTQNVTPGKTFFNERVKNINGKEYREWDMYRSKLAAALQKGISQIGLREGDTVLYLGASHGYTPSFIADIVGDKGFVFALDFAPRVVRDLVFLCEKRRNMAPILANAGSPLTYHYLLSEVDFVYQDVAQKDQTRIFLTNCGHFLKAGGFAILCVKARSIDITKKSNSIYVKVRQELEEHLSVVDYRTLDPFEKDHCIFVCKKKK